MKALSPIQVPKALPPAGNPIRLEWLSLKNLRIDDRYQREIDRAGVAMIRRIAEKFEWRKFAPVIVTPIAGSPGLYAIIDGQHRSTGALSRGFDKVPCAIVEATANEAAEIFSAVNGERRAMSMLQVYKAALVAKENWATEIKRVCGETGVTALVHPISARNQKPYQTMALAIMKRTIESHGAECLQAVLQVLHAMPNSHVGGFLTSAVIRSMLYELLRETDGRNCLEWASQRVSVLKRNAEVMSGPAPIAPPVVQPLQADQTPDVAARIQDLKQRGFTKSMTAAALRCRYALVEQHWGER